MMHANKIKLLSGIDARGPYGSLPGWKIRWTAERTYRGHARLEETIEADPETRPPIGSEAKAVAAGVVTRLVERAIVEGLAGKVWGTIYEAIREWEREQREVRDGA